MPKPGVDGGVLLKCSFCGKSQAQVRKLIAGPGVYICDECIALCQEIIVEELGAETAPREPTDDELADAARAVNDAVGRLHRLALQRRATPPEVPAG